jgi:arginine utilization protein RocB
MFDPGCEDPKRPGTWLARVRELTLALVRFPSVTGTPGEAAFARYLHDLLAGLPYFQAHPADLRAERATGDPLGRSNVFALARGAGPRTVILAGHYDVVSAANYGNLAPHAFDPEALLPRLLAELEATGSDQLALADLKSGVFMPGRGALDMKSGLAVGIAVLERFAASPEREGNVLLLATPDEEETSEGMRAAAARLPELAREWDLDLVAAINLDSTSDRGDGHDGRAIFMGSVGKLLPSVYVVGRDTHAGAPFDGVSATRIAAEITGRIECSPDLADMAGGEAAPPPVCLKHGDLKQGYDVTTPAAVWCYYNQLTHSWPPSEVLAKYTWLVRGALEAVLAELHERARRYAELAGEALDTQVWRSKVLTFAELRRLALDRGGAAAERALAELTARLEDDRSIDIPLFCRHLTELLWSYSGLSGPAAVVGLAMLAYPCVSVAETSARHVRMREVVGRQAEALSRETGAAIRLRPFFPGISDMSFLAGGVTPAELATIAENTPVWGSRVRSDYGAARALDLPVVNVGPWGRDYHQRLERVHMPYSFGVLPELVWRVAAELLGEPGELTL